MSPSQAAPPVVIVGAGLAGLACAQELHRRGLPYRLLEASDGPGGRVRTDSVEGFLLDRGFQVYLTAYPAGPAAFSYQALDFQSFAPGALVRFGGRFHRVMDPWREPFAALASLLNPVGSMADKLRVARLRATSLSGTVDQLLARPETTAYQALERYGFSPSMIERFFQPFFGGIMLDSELNASSRMLEFVFRMMATGDTVLPRRGMGSIPQAMLKTLDPSRLTFSKPVQAISSDSVTCADGEQIPARAVVLAVDAPSLPRFLPDLPPISSRAVTSLYFALSGDPPLRDRLILLDGNNEGLVQNLSIPSLISSDYAPPGQHLIGATVLGNPAGTDAELEAKVRAQLTTWFGPAVASWRLLRLYRIPHAHPTEVPSTVREQPTKLSDRLFICGDHRYFPSIQAALVNGKHAAEAVAQSIL